MQKRDLNVIIILVIWLVGIIICQSTCMYLHLTLPWHGPFTIRYT
jgi:hypothetical protein